MSHVPMTLPDLMLAEHLTTFFHSSTFTQLEDGRVLHTAGNRFTITEEAASPGANRSAARIKRVTRWEGTIHPW